VCSYDAGLPDGRLLLGLKGTISELELHTIRGRLTAGLLSKAHRGELALHLPAGLVRDPSGVVTKDPNQEVAGPGHPGVRQLLAPAHDHAGHPRAAHARPDAAPQ
jgi:DNA invertase Pin-like site-specific DNA recombinase